MLNGIELRVQKQTLTLLDNIFFETESHCCLDWPQTLFSFFGIGGV
jgi:hypothetical protein